MLKIWPVGGISKSGAFTMDEKTTSITLLGGVSLDLTQASFAAPVVKVRKFSLFGGVNMVVPPGMKVDVHGFALGGRNVETQPAEGGQVVQVYAYALSGGVMVRTA